MNGQRPREHIFTGKVQYKHTRDYLKKMPLITKNKKNLMKRYNLTEEGYREKFRKCKPEVEETIWNSLSFEKRPIWKNG